MIRRWRQYYSKQCSEALLYKGQRKITFLQAHKGLAGCLECGTCRVVCKNDGIVDWKYPQGSVGVNYRQG